MALGEGKPPHRTLSTSARLAGPGTPRAAARGAGKPAPCSSAHPRRHFPATLSFRTFDLSHWGTGCIISAISQIPGAKSYWRFS